MEVQSYKNSKLVPRCKYYQNVDALRSSVIKKSRCDKCKNLLIYLLCLMLEITFICLSPLLDSGVSIDYIYKQNIKQYP